MPDCTTEIVRNVERAKPSVGKGSWGQPGNWIETIGLLVHQVEQDRLEQTAGKVRALF
jgi:mannose/cellobiose epimerase-like protein (N-acyl-D-glucosamine 2-epimerase family)